MVCSSNCECSLSMSRDHKIWASKFEFLPIELDTEPEPDVQGTFSLAVYKAFYTMRIILTVGHDLPHSRRQRILGGTLEATCCSPYQIAGQALHFSLVIEYPVECED